MAQPPPPIIRGMDGGETIHKFLARTIRPDTVNLNRCLEIVDRLIRFLQSDASPLQQNREGYTVKRILKDGSLSKGTAVREMSDIDLIIFLNGYSSMRQLHDNMPTLLKTLKKYVEADSQLARDLTFKEITKFAVQFYLKVREDDVTHEVNLLPAIDITETMSKGAIYEKMKDEAASVRDLYSASLSPLQVKFLSQAPTKVKDLIRVLKYWTKVEGVPLRSHFLELVVMELWRREGRPQNFHINDYFSTVMQQLAQCRTMAVAFDDNYNFRLFRNDLRSPYLLDPANPFRNVGPKIGEVALVMEKANEVLGRLLFLESTST